MEAALPSSSLRRDVVSAYAASAAKIGSWVIVSGIVYRKLHPMDFALLALVRGTIGILNYTTLGLSPAMIRMLAEARKVVPAVPDNVLSYFTPIKEREGTRSLYANGLLIALICAAFGVVVTVAYAFTFNTIFRTPSDIAPWVVFWMGLGTVLRLASDAPGSVLQAHGQIARDNLRVIFAEVAWVLLCLVNPLHFFQIQSFLSVIALAYGVSGLLLLISRAHLAARLTGLWVPDGRLISDSTLKKLLVFGSLVLFAQLADYLYAPTDYILIKTLLGWLEVEQYTPAMQIDAGLLLLVTGLSSVILPHTALAHTAGDVERVRRYYVHGPLFSAALLLVAGVTVYLASPWIFRLWLGDPMKATQVILPLVLIHTIVGGSSAVGRSILLGMGKVRAFTIAVLVAGVSNVILSYIFVRYLHLGLKGIILGTIVVVVARCAIWMPWYVLRSLRVAATD